MKIPRRNQRTSSSASNARNAKPKTSSIVGIPRPIWRIPYRQGTSYVDERYDQVYVTGAAEADDARPRRLTDLNASYSQPRWSADGASIYSDRTTIPAGDEPWRAKNIFRLDVASGRGSRLSPMANSAPLPPIPSPDGNWIAYSRTHIGITDLPERLVVMSIDGAE